MKKILLFIITLVMIIFPYRTVKADNGIIIRGVVNTSKVVVRTSPSANSSIVKTDTGNDIYLYSPESVEVVGTSGQWYHVELLYSGFLYNL